MMINGKAKRERLESVRMPGVVAEKRAVSGIQSMAAFLDECHGGSLNSNQANDVDFFAHLASETGTPVKELRDFTQQKICEFRNHLLSTLKSLQSRPSNDILVDSVTDVYQASCSFYDNYGYLIKPECLPQFLDFLEALGRLLENLSDDFDVNDSLPEVSPLKKEDYNLDKLISAVGE